MPHSIFIGKISLIILNFKSVFKRLARYWGSSQKANDRVILHFNKNLTSDTCYYLSIYSNLFLINNIFNDSEKEQHFHIPGSIFKICGNKKLQISGRHYLKDSRSGHSGENPAVGERDFQNVARFLIPLRLIGNLFHSETDVGGNERMYYVIFAYSFKYVLNKYSTNLPKFVKKSDTMIIFKSLYIM